PLRAYLLPYTTLFRSHAVTVEVPSTGADLLVTAATSTYDRMTGLVVDELAHLPGVAAIRTHVVSEWFTQGGAWRLNALGPGERGDRKSTRLNSSHVKT